MKLTALRLHNVRRFGGRGVAVEGIGDGVNVLCAVNEFGKSTCFDALHALFFQPYSGTPGAVQALRPYSGGSPMIEADIATGAGRFRLTKQFYSGKRAMVTDLGSGRLVAQADEAERFIAGLVQGGTAGPAGLLWVRQGITGIERRAPKDEEGEKLARESVLTSVQGEVEALTGGRRMAQALAACGRELRELVTESRAKPTGPYAESISDRDRLVESERRLAAEVRELREALDRRRALRVRLAELQDPEQEARRSSDAVQGEAAFSAAKAYGEALKTAEVETALARNRRDAAQLALDGYRANLTRLATLRRLEIEGAAKRDAALLRQREAVNAGQAATAAVEAAENEERAARELLTRLDKALRARAAAEQLAVLRESHARAEAGRAEVETITAELSALALPAASLRQLETLETELAGLRAVAAAQAPLLRIAYREGADGAISMDGVAISDGEERPLTRSAALDIDGVGRLTLLLPADQGGQADLAKAEARRSALLATLGVAGLDEARSREARLRELTGKLELAKQRLGLLAPDGLPALRETIARLVAQSGETIEIKADPEALRSALAAAEARVATSRHAARAAQPVRDAASGAVVTAERDLAGLHSELAGIATLLGAEGERAAREAGLAEAFAAADQAFGEADARMRVLRAGATDIAAAEAKFRRMRSIVEAAVAETAKMREEIAGLNALIGARSNDAVEEAWQEARDRLDAAEARRARLEREVAILTRLQAALEAARAEAREHYFEPVMSELRPLLGLLFEDATVTFDEATLLPRSVRRNGQDEEVGVLSGGMREQLAVLTRLAFARLLAKDGKPAPVILDDALVYSDDDRIERMFDALHRQASDQQIIVFSCRQRAFAQLGGNILNMVPWTPTS